MPHNLGGSQCSRNALAMCQATQYRRKVKPCLRPQTRIVISAFALPSHVSCHPFVATYLFPTFFLFYLLLLLLLPTLILERQPPLLRHPAGQTPPRQRAPDVGHGGLLHGALRLDGPGAHVGHEQGARVRNQVGVDLGLVLVDVEAHGGDVAPGQEGGQGGLVDDGAPGRVDEDDARFGLGELRGGDYVFGGGLIVRLVSVYGLRGIHTGYWAVHGCLVYATYIQGQVQTQHIAPAQQLLEPHIPRLPGPALVLWT